MGPTASLALIATLILLTQEFSAAKLNGNQPVDEDNSFASGRRDSTTDSLQSNESTRVLEINEPHCVETPKQLHFCSARLRWAPFMRLPNQLGHRSLNELTDALASSTLMPASELGAVQCRLADQLKLLVCTTLAPVCLDTLNPPCRHLCMAAKASCRPALRRQGYEWPKFLDCRRFPRGPENCIGRLPIVLTNELTLLRDDSPPLASRNASQASKKRRKEKKERKALVSSATTTTTTTTSAPPTSVQPARVSPAATDQQLTSASNASATTTTTSAPAETVAITELPGVGNGPTPTAHPQTSSTTTTTTTTPTTTTKTEEELVEAAEGRAQSTSSPAYAVTEVAKGTELTTISQTAAPQHALKSAGDGVQPVTELSVADYSSMPIGVTDDLTQLICSTAPDWLIKTKLSDSQLVAAAKRRKLRVRNYRQLAGSLLDGFGANASSQAGAGPGPGRPSRRPINKSNNSPSVSLSLPDTTVFVTAMGPTLYIQPLTDALSRAGDSHTASDVKSSGRNYLISGLSGGGGGGGSANGSAADSPIRSTLVFVVLPSVQASSSDPDSRGGFDIMRTYREFKLRGASVCSRPQSRPPTPTPTSIMTTIASSSATSSPEQLAAVAAGSPKVGSGESTGSPGQAALAPPSKSPRPRKQRKKVQADT